MPLDYAMNRPMRSALVNWGMERHATATTSLLSRNGALLDSQLQECIAILNYYLSGMWLKKKMLLHYMSMLLE